MVVLELMVGDSEIPLVPSFYKEVPEPSPVAGWYVLLDVHVAEIKAGELVRVTCSNRSNHDAVTFVAGMHVQTPADGI
ncbi:MAG: hypothetical protein ACRENC_18600 [Gemmatimonadaceae bacterium]